jgi:hypothetical protein
MGLVVVVRVLLGTTENFLATAHGTRPIVFDESLIA